MDEEIVESKSSYRDMRHTSFRPSPLTLYLGLLGLLVVGAAIYQVREQLVWLAYFLIAVIMVVVLMGLVALYYRLRPMRRPAKAIPIASTGTIWYDEVTGKVTVY